jgi:hypothetical protein
MGIDDGNGVRVVGKDDGVDVLAAELVVDFDTAVCGEVKVKGETGIG